MSNHRCHAIKPVFELEEVHSGAQLEVDVEDRIVRSIVLSLKDDTMLDATVKEVLHGCVTSPATHERKQVREHQLLVGFHKRGAVMKPYKAIKTMIESKAAPHSVIMAEHMEPHHIAETKAQYEVLRNQMNKSAAPAPSNTSTKSLKPMSELIEEAAEAGMPATEGRATLAKLPYRTDWTGYIFKGGVAAFGDSMDAELQFPLSPNEIYGRDIVNAMMLCDEVQDAAVVCRTLSGTRSFLIFVEINRKPTMAHYKELARAIQDALTQQSCEAWYACVHGYSTEPFDFTVYYGQWDSGIHGNGKGQKVRWPPVQVFNTDEVINLAALVVNHNTTGFEKLKAVFDKAIEQENLSKAAKKIEEEKVANKIPVDDSDREILSKASLMREVQELKEELERQAKKPKVFKDYLAF